MPGAKDAYVCELVSHGSSREEADATRTYFQESF